MGYGLEVDTVGLRNAAASSDIAASTLDASSTSPTSSQPSSSGVAAVNAALSAVLQRQSGRITGHAANLTTGGALYDTADGDGADAISTVRV